MLIFCSIKLLIISMKIQKNYNMKSHPLNYHEHEPELITPVQKSAIEFFAELNGVFADEILSNSKSRDVLNARRMIVWFYFFELDYSKNKISKLLNIRRWSVYNFLQKEAKQAKARYEKALYNLNERTKLI